VSAEWHQKWGLKSSSEVNAQRRSEDREAMSILGLEAQYGEHLDAIYRGDRYLKGIQAQIHPEERDLHLRLAAELAERLGEERKRRGDQLIAPLGVGGHVDHRIVYSAARELQRSGWIVRFYEDYPYSDASLRPTQTGKDADPVRHRLGMLGYSGRTRHPICTYECVDAVIDRRIAAIEAYASQVPDLFGRSGGPGECVRGYASRIAAEARAANALASSCRFAERFWSLAE
jgi:LmbE family N-acetylglucosaminyl deacetylase